MRFTKWLDTLIEEKNINLDEQFEVSGTWGVNYMQYQNVIEAIKSTSEYEQKQIQNMLIKIDFVNGDIKHYLRHLAQAIAF